MADTRRRPSAASRLAPYLALAAASSALLLSFRLRPLSLSPPRTDVAEDLDPPPSSRSLLGLAPFADPRSEAPRPPQPLEGDARQFPRPPTPPGPESDPGQGSPRPPRRRAVLTSWLTYRDDPQRKGVRVSPSSMSYMRNLYVSATHLGIPLVVFHDALADDFVTKYANEHVSFVRVSPDPNDSTNDWRFTPYLEYVLERDLEDVLMVDASDVHFNRDPFEVFRMRGGEYNLFASLDQGTFYPPAWNVRECYGEESKGWDPSVSMHNAGVWGGVGDGLRCVLQCAVDQLNGPLKGRGRKDNCNMPAVNYCLSAAVGPCGDVLSLDPDPIGSGFVTPWKGPKEACLGEGYAIVHNKCKGTSCQSRKKVCPGEDVLCVEVDGGSLVKNMVPPGFCPDVDLPRVHVYVKTSGKPAYLARSIRIADTYGRGVDALTFLFDRDNAAEVDAFGRDRPWLNVRRVDGTEKQGDYHTQGGTLEQVRAAQATAYEAQRIKTRYVFRDFFGEDGENRNGGAEGGGPGYDWVCYMDDDMLLNVANLKSDLVDLGRTCLPSCLVTDEKGHGGIKYTQGGWCMNVDLARRTAELLAAKTDEELRWTSTDDVSFNQAVMQWGLGVRPTNSARWWSELAWRRKDAKFVATKEVHWGTLEGVRREILPSLAAYHVRFAGQP